MRTPEVWLAGKWGMKQLQELKIVKPATVLLTNHLHRVTMTATKTPIRIPIQEMILFNHALSLFYANIKGAIIAPINTLYI